MSDAFGSKARFVYNHHACSVDPDKSYDKYHVPEQSALLPVVCREAGIQFVIVPRHRGQDPFLFLDLRNVRQWVRDHAVGKSVLNLFSYTCGVGLAAAFGGAQDVWNVDFGRACLDVGASNAALNRVAVRWLGNDSGTGASSASGLPLLLPTDTADEFVPTPASGLAGAVTPAPPAAPPPPKRRGRPARVTPEAAAPSAPPVAASVAAVTVAPAGASMSLLRDDVYPVLWQLSGTEPKKRKGRLPAFTPLASREFDLIVMDPPPRSRGKFQAVDVERDYQSLFKPAVLAASRGGTVVATNHSADVTMDAWREALTKCVVCIVFLSLCCVLI
jgi:hypothetical protein